MTEHENRIREALLIAAVNCPHEITEEQVTFYFNAANPGNNALDQLMTRLEDAAIRAILADLDAMRAKAARYDYLSDRFVGADFDWNESGLQALVFKVEPGTQVWATADKTIDGAIAALKGASA